MTESQLPMRPLTHRELIAIDSVLAVLLTAVYLGLSLSTAPAGGARPATAMGVLVILLMGLPIAVRRFWPLPVFVVVLTASAVAFGFGVLNEPFVAAALAGYTAAASGRRLSRRGWTSLAVISSVLVLLSVSTGTVGPWAGPLGTLLPGLALVGAMWTLGTAIRERRAYARARNDDWVARAVADERLRIAREVHDIVTHNLGVITVKAAVARHVAATDPDEVLDALTLIESVSRDALTDMRQVLQVLRAGPADRDDRSQEQPLPGVRDLQTLRKQASFPDLDLRWEVTGEDQLSPAAALSTYRILQEALTNVIKHAGPTSCQVTVRCTSHEVTIDVCDDGERDRRAGDQAGAPGEGYGLLGMRERVAMHGGDLVAGPRDGGGYQVLARLPFQPITRTGGAR